MCDFTLGPNLGQYRQSFRSWFPVAVLLVLDVDVWLVGWLVGWLVDGKFV
jgi:hypothetical protein